MAQCNTYVRILEEVYLSNRVSCGLEGSNSGCCIPSDRDNSGGSESEEDSVRRHDKKMLLEEEKN